MSGNGDAQRFYVVIIKGDVIRVRIENGVAVEWKPADASPELKAAALVVVAKIEPLRRMLIDKSV